MRLTSYTCMQATASAITKGKCMNSEAITDVLAEAGGNFDAFSTCGETASVMEAEPAMVEKEVKKANAAMAARKANARK